MSNEQRPLREDLMREVRKRSMSIGLLIGVTVTALIIGFLTGWKY